MGKERLHHPTPDDVTLDRVLGALSDPIRRKITRRDSVIENLFPGLLHSVGLPPGQGQWDESAANTTDT